MISTKLPRNFARYFLLPGILFVWQVSVFAIDRLPDRREFIPSSGSSSGNTGNRVSGSSEALVELLDRVNRLQNELEELRNQSEIQGHEIDRLKSQQKDVLQDLDKRISSLEHGKQGDAASAPGSGAKDTTTILAPTRHAGSSSPDARKEYDAAFTLLKQGAYEKASRSFQTFVKRHPEDKLTGNAQYWIGEANYVMRNFKSALVEFKKVPEKYPGSSKVADAELKIGYVYIELNDVKSARNSFNEVIKKYPNSRVAKYAKDRLAKLAKNKKKKK